MRYQANIRGIMSPSNMSVTTHGRINRASYTSAADLLREFDVALPDYDEVRIESPNISSIAEMQLSEEPMNYPP